MELEECDKAFMNPAEMMSCSRASAANGYQAHGNASRRLLDLNSKVRHGH